VAIVFMAFTMRAYYLPVKCDGLAFGTTPGPPPDNRGGPGPWISPSDR